MEHITVTCKVSIIPKVTRCDWVLSKFSNLKRDAEAAAREDTSTKMFLMGKLIIHKKLILDLK